MRNYWQQMSSKQRLLAVVAVALAVPVALRYVDLGGVNLPLPKIIDARESELRQRQKQLSDLQEKRRQRGEVLTRLRSDLEPYFWQLDSSVPATAMQSEIDRLGRRARVTIQTLGAPQTNDFTENIRSVEMSLRLNLTMREIARLMAEFENADHRVFWTQCSIRPNNPRDPTGVVFSGRIQALLLSESANQLLNRQEGSR